MAVFNTSQFWIVDIFTTDQTFTEFIAGHKTFLQTNCHPFDKNLIIHTNLKYFSLITDDELDFPSNSLSSCEALFNTSEVAFYYLKTLNITGCTLFTNLTKSSFPTGYSITHLKLSYGGLEHVEADSLLVSRDRPKDSFSHWANIRSKPNVRL